MSGLSQARLMADVSDYQATVNLARYRAAGRRAVMIKATEGLGEGGATNWQGRAAAAHTHGLIVVHYCFCHLEVAPDATVSHLLARVRPEWRKGDRFCFDVELGEPLQAVAWLLAAQRALMGHGAPEAIGYTYEDYMARGGRGLALSCPWWIIAAYDGLLLGRGTPRLPGGGRLLGKQYTDGTIGAGPRSAPGIGPCDDTILTTKGASWLMAGKPAKLRRALVGRRQPKTC